MEISSMDQLKRHAVSVGSHYFDRSTLRWFGSRVSGTLYRVDGDRGYFVTSERDSMGRVWDGERRYSVRRYTVTRETVEFDTVGEFGEYSTGAAAHRAARAARAAAIEEVDR